MKRDAGDICFDGQQAVSKRKRPSEDADQVVSKSAQRGEEMFKYEALPASREAFRLVRIKSVDGWGNIRCRIYNYEASSCPHYYAISYCWGNDNDPCMIQLNGQGFHVGRNLLSLLQNFGPLVKGKYLWIDAICIDQSSTMERNHQVRMMGQIYSGARHVVAWLGVMDEDCLKALSYLRRVMRYKGSRTRADAKISSSLQHLGTLLALRRFLERDYWHRTWIVQEVLLAQRIRLVCGTKEVKWFRLQRLQELWSQADFPGGERARILDIGDCMIFQFMKQRRRAIPDQLCRLIAQYKHSKCQDPRDKVYALLALATDCREGSTLDVDYNKSIEQVFCDVLLFCKDVLPDLRMTFAGTLREVLGLALSDIQAFVRHETNFTWKSFRSLDRREPDQIKVPTTSINRLQEYEGLLVGTISSVSSAHDRGDLQPCWASDGSKLPDMDTYFEISGAQEARFAYGANLMRTGYVLLQYANLSFGRIAKGDLVYQLNISQMALVFRPVGTNSGYLVAVARTGNIVRASPRDSKIQRRTFWLSPSEVLGLHLILLARLQKSGKRPVKVDVESTRSLHVSTG